jgi:hypothetical protein
MKRVFLVAAAALLGATAAEAATTTAPTAAGAAPGAPGGAPMQKFWPKPGHAWLDQPAAAELWRSSWAARFTDL